jgi:hypothetical protein
VEAAGAAVAAWTPVKRAGIERRRQEAEDTRTWHRDNRARAVEKGKAAPVEQLEVAEVSRAAAHADFRARLRAAKAARA